MSQREATFSLQNSHIPHICLSDSVYNQSPGTGTSHSELPPTSSATSMRSATHPVLGSPLTFYISATPHWPQVLILVPMITATAQKWVLLILSSCKQRMAFPRCLAMPQTIESPLTMSASFTLPPPHHCSRGVMTLYRTPAGTCELPACTTGPITCPLPLPGTPRPSRLHKHHPGNPPKPLLQPRLLPGSPHPVQTPDRRSCSGPFHSRS